VNESYLDRDGTQWYWWATEEGYCTEDGIQCLTVDELREKYGPLEFQEEGSWKWVREPESQEQLFRRIIREELDRRFGRTY